MGCGGKRTAHGIKKDVKENMLSHYIYVQTLLESVMRRKIIGDVHLSSTAKGLIPTDLPSIVLYINVFSQ